MVWLETIKCRSLNWTSYILTLLGTTVTLWPTIWIQLLVVSKISWDRRYDGTFFHPWWLNWIVRNWLICTLAGSEWEILRCLMKHTRESVPHTFGIIRPQLTLSMPWYIHLSKRDTLNCSPVLGEQLSELQYSLQHDWLIQFHLS